jgi:serine O-acetyltransferase
LEVTLKFLLYNDLSRQLALEGRPDVRPGLFRLLCRVAHHRFLPIVLCRLARSSRQSGIPLVPGVLTYLNIVLFGLEVSSRCEIGPGIFFPHTSGTVVGAWRLGSNVTVYQGVTVGAKELNMQFDPALRPDVGHNVVLGAGCKILGGIRLGDNVVVGANSVVVNSVEPGATVVGSPARPIVSRKMSV